MEKIISKNNNGIKLAHALLDSSKSRKKENLFIAEGLRICYDGYLSGFTIKYLFVTENALEKNKILIEEMLNRCEKSYILSQELFLKISETKSPQGIICIFSNADLPKFELTKDNKYLVLENIQDPSNLGTIIRTAEAFNIDGLVLSKNTCDYLNPKVIRGSMGGVFRLPIMIADNFHEYLKFMIDNKIKIYSSVVDKNADLITEIKFYPGTAVIIGNEANGITDETKKLSDKLFTIPMDGRAESLNAAMAAGIIIWEFMK